jgi:hypothetical protein
MSANTVLVLFIDGDAAGSGSGSEVRDVLGSLDGRDRPVRDR